MTTTYSNRTPFVRVKLNTSGQSPITIQSSINKNRLDTLVDVVASDEVDGGTLVYDSSNDKYIVRKLTLRDVEAELDGGEF